jgi:hypothetical protein
MSGDDRQRVLGSSGSRRPVAGIHCRYLRIKRAPHEHNDSTSYFVRLAFGFALHDPRRHRLRDIRSPFGQCEFCTIRRYVSSKSD